MQVKSKFDYFGVKAGVPVEVLETVEQDSFATSYYKVKPEGDDRIHYLLFAEVGRG